MDLGHLGLHGLHEPIINMSMPRLQALKTPGPHKQHRLCSTFVSSASSTSQAHTQSNRHCNQLQPSTCIPAAIAVQQMSHSMSSKT